jgi:hypothetical protein
MGRTIDKHKYKLKPKTLRLDGVCRLVDNGDLCLGTTHCRGLCSVHHTRLLRHGTIERWALPEKFKYFDKAKYKVLKKVAKGVCRIFESGKSCGRSVHGRGLCARHWLIFNRHDVIEKYGGKSRKAVRTFRVKKKVVKGICRIVENHKGCDREATSRGLCSMHYLRFLRDGRIKKFGNK